MHNKPTLAQSHEGIEIRSGNCGIGVSELSRCRANVFSGQLIVRQIEASGVGSRTKCVGRATVTNSTEWPDSHGPAGSGSTSHVDKRPGPTIVEWPISRPRSPLTIVSPLLGPGRPASSQRTHGACGCRVSIVAYGGAWKVG